MISEASIIVSNKNRLDVLKQCLKSIVDYTKDVNYDLYIIDAGSTDGSREYLSETWSNKSTLIFEEKLSTYAESNNRVMRMCNTKYIYLLNNDCLCLHNWLRNAINFANNDIQIGHVASLVLWDKIDGKIQSHGVNLNETGNTIFYNNPEKINNFAYAGLGLYRKDILEKVNYMPEYPSKIYWSDTGYGLRVWEAGYDLRYCPDSRVIHLIHESERNGHYSDTIKGQEEFMKEWGDFLKENNGFYPNYPFTGRRPYSK